MFAKLKTKIETEGSPVTPKLSSSRRSTENLYRISRASTESLNTSLVDGSGSQSETPNESGRRSDGLRSERRNNAATNLRERESVDGRLVVLERENARLKKEVEETRANKLNRLEEADELADRQTQEMSKLKHLLLNKEEFIDKMEAEVKMLSELVVDRDRAVREASVTVEELRCEVERGQTEAESARNELVRCDSVRGELAEARGLLERRNAESSALQRMVHELEERLGRVVHDADSERSRNAAERRQLECEIAELRDTVGGLERQRGARMERSESEERPEEVEELIAERDVLEQRINESRLQLNNIKTTWSSRIDSLERQIETLNGKISEDREELGGMVGKLGSKEEELVEERRRREVVEGEVESLKVSGEERVAGLREELDGLREEREGLRVELGGLRVEREGLMISLGSAGRDIEGLKEEIETTESAVRLERTRCRKLERELSSRLEESLESQRRMDVHREAAEAKGREVEELVSSLAALESRAEASLSAANLEVLDKVGELEAARTELETQLGEKTKTIRQQQQRINDLRKIIQADLGRVENSEEPRGSPPNEASASSSIPAPPTGDTGCNGIADIVNFQYLRHIVIRFILSNQIEAEPLLKVLSLMLQFTGEEEALVRRTIEWKMSWGFTQKPSLDAISSKRSPRSLRGRFTTGGANMYS